MDREHAEKLAAQYKEFSSWFNKTTDLTIAMGKTEEAKRIRRAIAEMLFLLDDAVRIPLVKDYPDLFPEESFED